MTSVNFDLGFGRGSGGNIGGARCGSVGSGERAAAPEGSGGSFHMSAAVSTEKAGGGSSGVDSSRTLLSPRLSSPSSAPVGAIGPRQGEDGVPIFARTALAQTVSILYKKSG